MEKVKRYDLIADWNLNRFCNFNCDYCYIPLDKRKSLLRKGEIDIDKIVNSFNKTKKTWLIHMSGGEPFLHPNFVELCKKLTKKHYISINTNLSLNIDKFCKKINPKKVEFIHCSLHLSQRKKLKLIEDFIQKIKKFKKSGFNVYVTQLMTPKIIKNFEKTFNFFLKRGIIIRPKIMKGKYKRKEYPQRYTKKQREILNKYMNIIKGLDKKNKIKKGHINPDLDKKFIFGYLSWKGKKCLMGKVGFSIQQDGSVYRCPNKNLYLGNIYEGYFKPLKKPTNCNAEICGCPYYGFLYAKGEPKIIYKKTNFLKETAQTPWTFIKFFPGLIKTLILRGPAYMYFDLVTGLAWRIGLVYGWIRT